MLNRFREFVHLRCRPLIVAMGTAGETACPTLLDQSFGELGGAGSFDCRRKLISIAHPNPENGYAPGRGGAYQFWGMRVWACRNGSGFARTVGRTPWSAADAPVGLPQWTHNVSARVRSRPGAGCGPGGPPHRGESHSKIPKTDRHPRSGCSNTSDTVFSYPLRPSLGVMAREQRDATIEAAGRATKRL